MGRLRLRGNCSAAKLVLGRGVELQMRAAVLAAMLVAATCAFQRPAPRLAAGGLRRGVVRGAVVDAVLTSAPTLALAAADLSATADDLASAFFGASLFPWLAMLYWLGHPKSGAPPGVVFGLRFLLVFVFASIPAAVGAGALYGESLADCDWLHGAAESLLAVTNCVVVLGFRDALAGRDGAAGLRTGAYACAAFAVLSAAGRLALGGAGAHAAWLPGPAVAAAALAEPANALSLPTWAIHTSSLVEWLVAMGLAWRYAAYANDDRWKGVTWGMLPLHTSGIVACTYRRRCRR